MKQLKLSDEHEAPLKIIFIKSSKQDYCFVTDQSAFKLIYFSPNSNDKQCASRINNRFIEIQYRVNNMHFFHKSQKVRKKIDIIFIFCKICNY